jgi:hypothetical protein
MYFRAISKSTYFCKKLEMICLSEAGIYPYSSSSVGLPVGLPQLEVEVTLTFLKEVDAAGVRIETPG